MPELRLTSRDARPAQGVTLVKLDPAFLNETRRDMRYNELDDVVFVMGGDLYVASADRLVADSGVQRGQAVWLDGKVAKVLDTDVETLTPAKARWNGLKAATPWLFFGALLNLIATGAFLAVLPLWLLVPLALSMTALIGLLGAAEALREGREDRPAKPDALEKYGERVG